MSEVAGSKRAQKALRDHEKDKEEQRIRDLRWVMSTPQGRRFVFDMIDKRCLLFSPSYTGTSETYLREGQRKIGIWLFTETQQHAVNEYVQMISEAFHLKKVDEVIENKVREIAKGEDE